MSSISSALKSTLRKVPGTGALQRLVDKTKSREAESEIENVIKGAGAADQESDIVIKEEKPEDVEKLCNKSRLKRRHRNIFHNQVPLHFILQDYMKTLPYQRKLFARYGASSKVEPGKLWPTQDELEVVKEKARLQFLITADQVHSEVESIKAGEEQRLKEIRDRDEEVASLISKIDILKEEMYKEAVEMEKELDAAEEKKNKRIEQVKQYFQYTLSVKDPRFKDRMAEMIQEEKEKERTAAKATKKGKVELKKQLKAAKELKS